MKRIAIALVASLALMLTGCITVQVPQDTADSPTDTDRVVLEAAWDSMDAEGQETICWGLETFGREFTEDIWEHSTITGEQAADFFEDVC